MKPESARAAPVSLPAYKDPRLAAPAPCLDEAAWLQALTCLNATGARTLLLALRTLYPHDALGDPVYRRAVAAFDRAGAASPAARGWLADFVAAVDGATHQPFVDLSESYRVGVLKSIEHSRAFRFVQRAGVRHVYDDLEVWQAFGYEGASYHLGGYLERGFDDLDWLPAIPVKG